MSEKRREMPTITLGRLRRELADLPDDCLVCFGGLEYYRPKLRAPNLVQIEFSETVFLDPSGAVVVQNHER